MQKRSLFLGANWKMHERPLEIELACAEGKTTEYYPKLGLDIVVFPTFLQIQDCLRDRLTVGAQYGHPDDSGAFSGDVSMAMLSGIGVTHVLCGHSDRRRHHHETDAQIAEQAASALRCGLIPILCIGETAEQRDSGKTKDVLLRQLSIVRSLQDTPSITDRLLLAYEPVWAISNGDALKPSATTEEARKTHRFIRESLHPSLQSIRIIYGGSMKGSNALDLLRQPGIDGGLIGGASLKPTEFGKIVEAALEVFGAHAARSSG